MAKLKLAELDLNVSFSAFVQWTQYDVRASGYFNYMIVFFPPERIQVYFKKWFSKTFPCTSFMITESSKGAFHHYNSTPAASITGVATVLSLKTHLNMFTNDIIPIRSFPDI